MDVVLVVDGIGEIYLGNAEPLHNISRLQEYSIPRFVQVPRSKRKRGMKRTKSSSLLCGHHYSSSTDDPLLVGWHPTYKRFIGK